MQIHIVLHVYIYIYIFFFCQFADPGYAELPGRWGSLFSSLSGEWGMHAKQLPNGRIRRGYALSNSQVGGSPNSYSGFTLVRQPFPFFQTWHRPEVVNPGLGGDIEA